MLKEMICEDKSQVRVKTGLKWLTNHDEADDDEGSFLHSVVSLLLPALGGAVLVLGGSAQHAVDGQAAEQHDGN